MTRQKYKKNAAARWNIIKSEIPESSVGAEIGVFTGDFTNYLLRKNLKKLYLVDPWYRLNEYWGWNSMSSPVSTLGAFRDILDKFESEINKGVVEPVVDISHNFLNNVPGKTLDWVYLDSSHNHLETCSELFLMMGALKANGVLLGDDFGRVKSALTPYIVWCKNKGHNVELTKLRLGQWKINYSQPRKTRRGPLGEKKRFNKT